MTAPRHRRDADRASQVGDLPKRDGEVQTAGNHPRTAVGTSVPPGRFNRPSLAVPADLDGVFAAFEARTNLEKGLPPGNPNRVYRLDRMRTLCRAFGDPQDRFKTVHIAGSKGKGSTAGYLAALLRCAGRKLGVYGSPHLSDYRERFRIEGELFPEETALSIGRMLLGALPEIEKELPGVSGATTFELLTLFAFLLFTETGCDTAVLETGLGGRLDATNVVSSPEAVILTPVELEHTDILGRRIPLIAREKAGIIKTGTRAWSAPQPRAARRVFRRIAREKNVAVERLEEALESMEALGGDSLGKKECHSGEGRYEFAWNLRWKDGRCETIQLKMGGRVQAENAALALLSARFLEPSLTANAEAAAEALRGVSLPGRFQWLKRRPPIIIDGAHTPRSVSALRDAFLEAVLGTAEDRTVDAKRDEPLLLFGCALGKNADGMAALLCGGAKPAFKEVVVSTPGTFKPSDPPSVAEAFRKAGAKVLLEPDPRKAWETVLREAGGQRPVLVTGSFFMAGEIAAINES